MWPSSDWKHSNLFHSFTKLIAKHTSWNYTYKKQGGKKWIWMICFPQIGFLHKIKYNIHNVCRSENIQQEYPMRKLLQKTHSFLSLSHTQRVHSWQFLIWLITVLKIEKKKEEEICAVHNLLNFISFLCCGKQLNEQSAQSV